MCMCNVVGDVTLLATVFAHLAVHQVVGCEVVCREWRRIASLPSTLAGSAPLRLALLDSSGVACDESQIRASLTQECKKAAGLLRLSNTGAFALLRKVELDVWPPSESRGALAEDCWLFQLLQGMPSIRSLSLRTLAPRSSTVPSIDQRTFEGFPWRVPQVPSALQVLRVEGYRFSFLDLSSMVAHVDLRCVFLSACDVDGAEVKRGIVRVGSAAAPTTVTALDCNPGLATTLLLSFRLTSLAALRLDISSDTFLRDELARAFRPPMQDDRRQPPELADMMAQAEAQLKAELRKRSSGDAPTPWQRLRQWMQAASRQAAANEVTYSCDPLSLQQSLVVGRLGLGQSCLS